MRSHRRAWRYNWRFGVYPDGSRETRQACNGGCHGGLCQGSPSIRYEQNVGKAEAGGSGERLVVWTRDGEPWWGSGHGLKVGFPLTWDWEGHRRAWDNPQLHPRRGHLQLRWGGTWMEPTSGRKERSSVLDILSFKCLKIPKKSQRWVPPPEGRWGTFSYLHFDCSEGPSSWSLRELDMYPVTRGQVDDHQ